MYRYFKPHFGIPPAVEYRTCSNPGQSDWRGERKRAYTCGAEPQVIIVVRAVVGRYLADASQSKHFGILQQTALVYVCLEMHTRFPAMDPPKMGRCSVTNLNFVLILFFKGCSWPVYFNFVFSELPKVTKLIVRKGMRKIKFFHKL